jgi:hypothetical protein
VEREEEEVRGDRRAQRRGEVRAWDGTKADEVRVKAYRRGMRRRSDACVCPNVRALATLLLFVTAQKFGTDNPRSFSCYWRFSVFIISLRLL